MNLKEIGKLIREKRKESLLDQATVATLAGVGINTLMRIERGEGNPRFDVLHRVLAVLGLEMIVQ
jgi:y4mF family transcriptional regulator